MAMFRSFFLGYIGQKNVFYEILERKNDFLFPKGLTHGFGPKMAIFQTFFLRQYKPGKFLFSILEQKNAFLGYKSRSSNSRKIDIFLKELTHGFGPKMAIYPTFLFRQYRLEKYLLRYSRTKNDFLGYKNKKFKKSKN